MAALTLDSLQQLRTDLEFQSFWQKLMELVQKADIAEPSLPRRRKAPARYEIGTGEHHTPSSVEDYYRPIYFLALDTLIQCISERFDQPGYQTYAKLHNILTNGAVGKDFSQELSSVIHLYAVDIDDQLLCSQLILLKTHFKDCNTPPNLTDIVNFVRPIQGLFSEVVKVIRLILVAPATNASSERSFSALCLIKNYLRTTMSQARLNHLMVMHVHRNRCDNLSLEQCANDFCSSSEHRKNLFGTF